MGMRERTRLERPRRKGKRRKDVSNVDIWGGGGGHFTFTHVGVVEVTRVSPSFSSLSGPQRRDKLTLPPSLFASSIPVETFQKERSVNIHHLKTGVCDLHVVLPMQQ